MTNDSIFKIPSSWPILTVFFPAWYQRQYFCLPSLRESILENTVTGSTADQLIVTNCIVYRRGGDARQYFLWWPIIATVSSKILSRIGTCSKYSIYSTMYGLYSDSIFTKWLLLWFLVKDVVWGTDRLLSRLTPPAPPVYQENSSWSSCRLGPRR